MSSSTKAHIITHFWDCVCTNEYCVSELQSLLGVNQSNLSKHIAKLLALNVIDYARENKQRFYRINPIFRATWDALVSPLTRRTENAPYVCPKCVTDVTLACQVATTLAEPLALN